MPYKGTPFRVSKAPKIKSVYELYWEIRMYCTITDIRGDYAFVTYEDTGITSEVAIALLPFGVDIGDKLKFENYEFSIA